MDAPQILQESLDKLTSELHRDKEKTKYDIQPISSGGANYTSQLFIVKLSTPGHDDLDIFAKVAAMGEAIRTTINAERLYRAEQIVYTDLLGVYKKMEQEYDVQDRLITPKLFGYNMDIMKETMLLENMSAKGFAIHNRHESVDWDYAAKAMTEIARWHGYSLAYSHHDPEGFAQIVSELQFQFQETDEGVAQKFLAGAIEATSEKNKPALLKFLGTLSKESYRSFYKPKRRPVLAHGDYRSSNILHRYEDGVLQMAPIDFQTVHEGCALTDIIYFIFTGTDQKFRKQHYKELIDHYYTQLGLTLQSLNVEVSEVYPRKDFDNDLHDVMGFGIIVAAFILPIVTVEASDAPKMSGDATVESFAVAPTEVYAERLNGIIEDYVEWGYL